MASGALAGKAVVITGAGRGLGRAYARLAAEQGAAVVVNDVDTTAAAEVVAAVMADGGRAVADGHDIASWDGAGALITHCVDAFGAVDGLVNNAGVFRIARITEQDPADLRAVIEVNLLGTAYCGLHALRAMLAQGHGSVVNVTSGAHAGTAVLGAYGASKGGVASLTYCWAAEVAGTGVRVNAVSPNAHTRMADDFERYLGTTAEGQNVGKTPEVNAPAVVFLLSDAAADLNGQVVRMDGDELSLMSHPAVLEPRLYHPQWTVDDVAAAFATELAGRAEPLGVNWRRGPDRR